MHWDFLLKMKLMVLGSEFSEKIRLRSIKALISDKMARKGTCMLSPSFELERGLRDAVNSKDLSFSSMLYHLKDQQLQVLRCAVISRMHPAFISTPLAWALHQGLQRNSRWEEEGKWQEVKSGLRSGGEGMWGRQQEFGSATERWRGVRSPEEQDFPCAFVCGTKHATVYAGGVMPVRLQDLLTEGFCIYI